MQPSVSSGHLREMARQHQAEAERHQLAAKKLLEAATALDEVGLPPVQTAGQRVSVSRSASTDTRRYEGKIGVSVGVAGVGGGGKRVEQLTEFLRARGPMKRKEIIAEAGMPEGTISMLLAQKEKFVQDEEGRWKVRSEGDKEEAN